MKTARYGAFSTNMRQLSRPFRLYICDKTAVLGTMVFYVTLCDTGSEAARGGAAEDDESIPDG